MILCFKAQPLLEVTHENEYGGIGHPGSNRYDDTRGILQLEFRSRAIYRYFDVPAPVHEDWSRQARRAGILTGRFGKVSLPAAVDKRAAQGGSLMARTVAALPAGSRITITSLWGGSEVLSREKVDAVLRETKRASVRERDLPAHVVVYYVIALALYMRSSYARCCVVCWKAFSGCWIRRRE